MDTGNAAVAEQFNRLPKTLQKVLFSEDMTDRIFSIGKENRLTVPQMEDLSDEINLLALGATKPSAFADNIRQRLSLDQNTAVTITKAVNEKVVAPMRDALMAYHGASAFALEVPAASEKNTEVLAQKPTAAPASPVAPAQLLVKQPPVETATDTPPVQKKHIVNWEDIPSDGTHEPIAATDAKNALEKALNDAPASAPTPKTTDTKATYKSADPYREPLE